MAAGSPRLAWAVALALAVALAALALVATPLLLEARDREQVRTVAAGMAARVTTFDSANLDAWLDRVQELATPAYARELTELVDEDVRAELAPTGVASSGQVRDVYVQRVEDDDAVAFALVRQVTTNAAGDEPAATEVRMVLRLRRAEGGWRVAAVEVLSGGAQAPLP